MSENESGVQQLLKSINLEFSNLKKVNLNHQYFRELSFDIPY